MYLYFSNGNGQPREPALCQLYLYTFVPYKTDHRSTASRSENSSARSHSPLNTHIRTYHAYVRTDGQTARKLTASGAIYWMGGGNFLILSTVQTSCTTIPQQIAVMELEDCSSLTSSKQPRLVDCRIGVVNKLYRRY